MLLSYRTPEMFPFEGDSNFYVFPQVLQDFDTLKKKTETSEIEIFHGNVFD